MIDASQKRNRRRRGARMRKTSLWVVIVALAAASSAQGSAVFRGIGDLSGGGVRSEALGVSPDGTAVVGSSASSKSSYQACRWVNGTIAGLAIPGGSGWLTRAHAASNNGSVIAGRIRAAESDYGEAVVWEDGHMTRLGFLGGAPAFDSQALAVTADGSKITGFSTNGTDGIEAFIRSWPNGSMMGLGNGPGESYSTSLGISSDGSVMAGWTTGTEGFDQAARIQSDGTIMVLEDLPGGPDSSHALSVSADGSTIVGQGRSDSATEAVRWTPDLHVHSLGAAEAGQLYSLALAVSGNGASIVGSASGQGRGIAFQWDATHGFRNLETILTDDYGLDITGWMLVSANGVSADGQVIVGDGINPSGNVEGWIAILDNSPRVSVGRTQVSWIQPYHPNGTRWDVVRGGLTSLHDSGGSFQLATLGCVANNTSSTTVNETSSPAAGDGFWILVRQAGDSYDEAYGNQVGSRDPEIAASGHACP